MKLKTSIYKRCKGCFKVKRGKYLYIYCNSSKKHKLKQK